MANKTNCVINGVPYYRIRKTVGKRLNKVGNEVDIVKAFYGKNKKEAEEKYNEYMKRKALNLDSSKQYFGVMADRWINEFLLNEGELKNTTVRLYVGAWNNYMRPSEIYNLPLDEVTSGSIQALFNKLSKEGCPITQIKAVKKTLHKYYRYLVNNGYVPYDFTNSLTIPKRKKEGASKIVVWSDEELACILNNFDKAKSEFRLRFFIILATYTGLRISELRGVKYEDIEKTPTGYVLNVRRQVSINENFNEEGKARFTNEVTTLKSANSYRTIPLTQRVVDELKIHRKWHRVEQMKNGYRTDYIFTTESGGFYDSANINRALDRYYKCIGLNNIDSQTGKKKACHTYRRTFGTNLYRKGVPILTACKLMGHSDISVTAKYYIGTGEEEKRRAVELLEDIV